MARSKRKSERVSFRWSADIAESVRQFSDRTGWSESKSAALLVRCGSDALAGRHVTVAQVKEAVMSAEVIRKAEKEAGAIMAAARKKVRAGPALV